MSPSASSDNIINIDDQAQNDLLVPNKNEPPENEEEIE